MTKEDLQAISELMDEKFSVMAQRLDQRMDEKFAAQEQRLDQRMDEKFAAQEQRTNEKFALQDHSIAKKFLMNEQRLDQKMDQKFAPVLDRLDRIELTLENEIKPAIDALVEGQDLTHEKIKALAGRDELQELRDELALQRTVLAVHTREIEILKQAQ